MALPTRSLSDSSKSKIADTKVKNKTLTSSAAKPKPAGLDPGVTRLKDRTAESVKRGRTLTGGPKAVINVQPRTAKVDVIGRLMREGTAAVLWGRFNPPTAGHDAAVAQLLTEDAVPIILMTPAAGNFNNPLPASQRQALLAEAYGDRLNIVSVPEVNNALSAMRWIAERFENVIWVTGEDRAADYERILRDYNGRDFVFESARVMSLKRDADSDLLNEMASATLLRDRARAGDMGAVQALLPESLQHRTADIVAMIGQADSMISEAVSQDDSVEGRMRAAVIRQYFRE